MKDLNSHIWDQWTDENGTIGKAYGYQLGKKYEFKTKEGIKEMDQVDYVLYLLKNDPSSRRIMTNIFNHEEDRTRKLLLHKKEILKLRDKLEVEGYTLVPLKIYFVKNKAKVLIGVAKGKKNYNKKETIKERDIKREMERNFKYR